MCRKIFVAAKKKRMKRKIDKTRISNCLIDNKFLQSIKNI